MTPFGEKIRAMREARGLTQADMAAALQISAAYLSALEHGHRGRPSWALVQRIITYFNVIWDEAEDLEARARLSHPRVTVDTSGLNPKATYFVNRLAREIGQLPEATLDRLMAVLTDKR
ncbi:helix-turn-helix domain-containing protein [Govanella unica]|uniref:Helix-turn-helix domain-containing protein n=1 Tax=Govanella unica TaxID=2975056 RepID=A0A9X3TV92_9PROT|nr:helix-turn-helix transcriptional regulator [Govania unica]MDA5192368.1 helix-turn-helix domain-containing protein [Govania unica]